VKALMKERGITKEQYMQYDIRQKALKLTANRLTLDSSPNLWRLSSRPKGER